MIRVVQVLEATAGGTRRYLRYVVDALPREEFDVRIVCATRRDPAFAEDVAYFRRTGRRVHVLEMVRNPDPFGDRTACRELRSLLVREPCDVLHLHSSKAGWIGRFAARGLACRVVYTPHAFPFLQRVSLPLRLLYATAERVHVPRTDLLLAVGAAEARQAVERALFPPTRVRALPNAIDQEELRREVRRQPCAEANQLRRSGAFVVGLLGDLRPQKDPMTFVRAAALLRERAPDARFVLPAKGLLLRSVRRAIARLRLEELVRLVPAPGRLLPYYGAIDVGVLPSFWEGLPYTLLEALAMAVPVVASDIEPVTEVLRPLHGPPPFAPGSARALAERIEELRSMPPADRRELGLRGRELVRARHAIEPWREQVRATYRSLALRVDRPLAPVLLDA